VAIVGELHVLDERRDWRGLDVNVDGPTDGRFAALVRPEKNRILSVVVQLPPARADDIAVAIDRLRRCHELDGALPQRQYDPREYGHSSHPCFVIYDLQVVRQDVRSSSKQYAQTGDFRQHDD